MGIYLYWKCNKNLFVFQTDILYKRNQNIKKQRKEKHMKDIIITKTNFNNLADVGLESAEIYFIYEDKNYICKYEKNDKINFYVYDENKNLVVNGVCKQNGESLEIVKNNLAENEHDAKMILLMILKEMIMNAKD